MLKKNKIIILEDSSQSGYGGGQRITEEIFKIKPEKYTIVLVDTINSILIKRLSKIYSEKYIHSLNLKINYSKNFLFNINMILKSFYLIKKYSKSTKYLYITTRKHLFTGILSKIFFPNIIIYYHYHLTTGKGLFWSIYDLLVLLISNKLIFASEYTYTDFIKKRNLLFKLINIKKCHISPLPPAKWSSYETNNSPYLPTEPFVIAYIGKLIESKGIILFLETLKLLPSTFKWQAWIAGDGELRKTVEESVKNYKWNGALFYFNNIETNFDFYKKISLVIVPSFHFIETIGLSALEAIQAGIPTLTPATGNLKFYIEKNLSIQIIEDKFEIVNTINNVLSMINKNNKRNITFYFDNNFQQFYQDIFL